MSRSLSLLVPALMGHDANLMLAAAGMGERNFRTLCYDAGGLMVGLHDWQEAARYTDLAEPDDGWAAHDLTAARVAEITAAMVLSDLPYAGLAESYDEFADLASGAGVTWGARLPKLPDPGSMATVTKDEFYRTDQPGFAVVKVEQTHTRNNPAHTDLNALRAQFVVQHDPFNPPAWVQPLGGHDAYQLTNLIGGPMLVTHEVEVVIDGVTQMKTYTWRNKVAANSWEPGAPGTAGLWEIYA